MIILLGDLKVDKKDVAAFKAAAEKMIRATREEAGCLSYTFGEDTIEPGLFRIAEKWASPGELDAHMKSAHMGELQQALSKMQVLGLRVVAIDGANERVVMGG